MIVVMKRLPIAAAVMLGASLALSGPLDAAQDDSRLYGLFAGLRVTGDADEGARLGREIVAIWQQSGRIDVDNLMAQGQRLIDIGTPFYATEHFRQVTRVAPEFAEAWNKRAHANFLMGDFDSAIAYINETLKLEPRHFLALVGLGTIYIRLGDERAALDAFERALAINPHLPSTRKLVGGLRRRLEGRDT